MKKAISLYELLIVISIIAIVTAVSIPVLNHYLPSLKLSSSSKVVLSKLRQAQEEAVTTQIKHGVQFNVNTLPDTASIDLIKFVEGVSPAPPTITVLENIQLSNNIALSIDPTIRDNIDHASSILFSSDGGPDVNGNITITLDSASKTINISPSGVIKIGQ